MNVGFQWPRRAAPARSAGFQACCLPRRSVAETGIADFQVGGTLELAHDAGLEACAKVVLSSPRWLAHTNVILRNTRRISITVLYKRNIRNIHQRRGSMGVGCVPDR
jgi:hypothetical protein